LITKISYKECMDRLPNFPKTDRVGDSFFYPKEVKYRVLLLPSKSAKGHAKLLASEIVALLRPLNQPALVFCSEQAHPWRRHESDYPPVQEALLYLKQNKVGKSFDGALEVDVAEQATFFKHLFWLVRCHAALPIIHFMDLEQSIVGTICQYGGLHISMLSTAAESKLQHALALSKFVASSAEKCHSTFTKSAKIAHRQIIV
jgi:hypothetical protein